MFRPNRSFAIGLLLVLLCGLGGGTGAARPASIVAAAAVALPNPILFVTQVPVPADFTTIGSVFGNQRAGTDSVARGGDLWIRYPDGTLKNLTQAAGYGGAGFQGATSIAVRDPSVHWSGTKALFSMVVGAPTQQYQTVSVFWQIYEISGLGENETPAITKVANQPSTYNNISPIYGTDDRIIFTTDRPRNGQAHLYPQRDEYEEAPTVTGLWSLDPTSGDLFQLDHAPSGDFTPIIDSFGRVVFTRWDHLQRDQQADSDAENGGACGYCTFNYSDESAQATWQLYNNPEVFPEPRASRTDLLAGTHLAGHSMNVFFPWMINEDGTEAETLNHIGRHELTGYIPSSRTDDDNLYDFYDSSQRFNKNPVNNLLQIKESAVVPGLYYGIDAPEFSTHASGQVVSLNGAPSVDADKMSISYLTHRDTSSYTDQPDPNHSGHYRDPLPLSDGTLIAAHTAETDLDKNIGSPTNPLSRYDFRLKTLKYGSSYWVSDQVLTPGISKSVSYYANDQITSYSGELWELQPAEVRARTRPARRTEPDLATPEQQMVAQSGANEALLRAYLKKNNLALVVSRDVTTRDDADRQQPFNLRISGGAQTTGASGTIYDVSYFQFFQADQIRGLTSGPSNQPQPGRRVLAQPMHDSAVQNPPNSSGLTGSVVLGSDGSMAAFVPARRAMTWQMTDSAGTGVVRERFWLTFQPGEVRLCTSCHGINEKDQAGDSAPTNAPQSLKQLLQYWDMTLAKPNIVALTFKTEPAGLVLSADGQTISDSQSLSWWKAYPLTLDAPTQRDSSGKVWRFVGWSDGGAMSHTITTPTSAATYTATFEPAYAVWVPGVMR